MLRLIRQKLRLAVSVMVVSVATLSATADTVVDMTRYGIYPDRKENIAPKLTKALQKIRASIPEDEPVTLRLAPGTYRFAQKGSLQREYYISNHDQNNPKSVGIAIEGWNNLTIEGNGSTLLFDGRMLPIAVIGSRNVTLKGLRIDFGNPHISQVTVISNNAEGITFETAPWVNAKVENNRLVCYGNGWSQTPRSGIAFEPDTRHIVYRTSDLWIPLDSVLSEGKNIYRAPKWNNPALLPGTVVALRGYGRPTPGIFLADNENSVLEDILVHYAEGMGVLAQMCHNVTLTDCGVCLKGKDDPRYFTTQADATHFSGCSGVITSTGGLYEGMMDDAINVHGTYLRVTERVDARTLRGRYMHGQSYGFRWGEPGDTVQPVQSVTMEAVPQLLIIESITPTDKDEIAGAKEFLITFTTPVDSTVTGGDSYGLENLTRCPTVVFTDNTIRNNRARGSLFSTPRPVLVERNLFDHTSGTAILLCGDCMGWFETGACRDVLIRNNKFVNSLTNMFQFTEAVISIYPEIHDLKHQQLYFHGGPDVRGVEIVDNEFDTFDAPILYAKSIDGLRMTNNVIRHNDEYKPFHRNRYTVRLQRARRVVLSDNDMQGHDFSVSVD